MLRKKKNKNEFGLFVCSVHAQAHSFTVIEKLGESHVEHDRWLRSAEGILI